MELQEGIGTLGAALLSAGMATLSVGLTASAWILKGVSFRRNGWAADIAVIKSEIVHLREDVTSLKQSVKEL